MIPIPAEHAEPALIAIGSSIGGPTALRVILASLPVDAPPVVIAQHMIHGCTNSLAQGLDDVCTVHVSEAVHGQVLARGHVYVAPAGLQTEVYQSHSGLRLAVRPDFEGARFRPSVDVLFRSVARSVGAQAVGVLLSGMGNDGADGLLAMRAAGAYTLAQDEASCAVYGMPRAACLNGAVLQSVALESLAHAILEGPVLGRLDR